jgi:hypothetical protein
MSVGQVVDTMAEMRFYFTFTRYAFLRDHVQDLVWDQAEQHAIEAQQAGTK